MNAPVSLAVRHCVAWSRRAIDRFHFDTAAFRADRADRAGNVAIIFALNVVSEPQNQCVGFSRENTTESQSFWGKLRKIVTSG
jgi:hypothetical protein